jgi:cytoskeletal protein RodZ
MISGAKRIAAKVVLFNQENGEISIESVLDKGADVVETKSGMFSLESAKTYVDPDKGELVYVFNVDIPARVEAENLKKLRRSVTIKNLFNFERATGGTDWIKMLPYLIIIIMVIFHK